MHSLWQDLKFAMRQLARAPGFTAVAVVTLALGIGANTAMFSVVNAVLLRSLPYSQPERLVVLAEVNRGDDDPVTTSFGTFALWRARSHVFESMALHRDWNPTLLTKQEPVRLRAKRVSAEFFSVLRVSPALGRNFRKEEDSPDQWQIAILSHALWKQRFSADPEIVGKSITLNGTAFTVAGVLPESFRPVYFGSAVEPVELWAPLGYGPEQPWACRSCRHLQAVARLRPSVSVEQARAEINTVERSLVSEFPSEYSAASSVAVEPLHERLVSDARPTLLVLLAAVALVLLIACANVANLLLARAAGREREIAIRIALGAGRARLIRQLLTESGLLALLGGSTGLLLSIWGVDLLTMLGSRDIPRMEEVGLDASVLLATLLTGLLAGLLVGVAPALRHPTLGVSEALKEGARTSDSRAHARLRSGLVVAEISLACLLAVGAGLLVRSVASLMSVDPGFDTQNLLTLNTYASGPRFSQVEAVAGFYHEVFQRIEALPGVESVGAVTPLPLGGSFDRAGFFIEGRPLLHEAEAPSIDRYLVNGSYFRAARIPLLQGRELSEQEMATGAPVVLVSRSTARHFWPDEDPIGHRVRLGGPTDPWRTIVGIVGDVRHYELHTPPTHQVYATGATSPGFLLTLVVRTSTAPDGLERAVREAIWSVDKERPVYSVALMDKIVADSVARRRFSMFLVAGFAVLALLLAAVGVYGVVLHSVTQRTREIGIRSALGAEPAEIFRLILGQGFWLALMGVGIGVVSALVLTRFLSALLFGVSATDPATFAVVSLLLTAVALLACYIPARRATRVDPMTALRYE